MNAKGFIIWTVICVIGAVLFVWIPTREETYVGSNLTFIVGDTKTMNINTPQVKMEAADDGYFALRNGSDTLVGKPMPKPLGWGQDAYFTAELDQAPGGLWQIEKGSGVTIHLVSESTMTVVIVMNSGAKSSLIFLIVLAAFCIWFFGMIATA